MNNIDIKIDAVENDAGNQKITKTDNDLISKVKSMKMMKKLMKVLHLLIHYILY